MNIGIKTAFVGKNLQFSLLTFCLLIIPTVSIGAIYKWVDEQGKTHYGNKRPETRQVEKMKLNIKQAVTAKKDTNDGKNTAKDPKEKAEQQRLPDTLVEAPLSKKEKNRLCKQAKADIVAIQSSGRIRQRDSKGNAYYLSDKQRTKRLADAKKMPVNYVNKNI